MGPRTRAFSRGLKTLRVKVNARATRSQGFSGGEVPGRSREGSGACDGCKQLHRNGFAGRPGKERGALSARSTPRSARPP